MSCGRRKLTKTLPNAPFTSDTSGVARQKPGRVVLGHFRDWLLCYNGVQAQESRGISISAKRLRHGGSVMVRG